jgi:anhydro-N-acetylmuramic acid kinase
MSGTSLDGLDIALCRIEGSGTSTSASVLHFETRNYDAVFRNEVLDVFSRKQVDLEKLCLLNEQIAILHASYVLDALRTWGLSPVSVDCIASHGQTVYHAPKRIHRQPGYPDATLQIGDGDQLAVKTGILTLSDFRQKHIAAGGEGAPLAIYADELLFSSPEEDRFLLNIGGIANFTWLPAGISGRRPLSTDTGPGNTLINDTMRTLFGREYDENGIVANTGAVHDGLLQVLMAHPFFEERLPKTTGPELFNGAMVRAAQGISRSEAISPNDLIATLTQFTAESIARAVRSLSETGYMYVSGGGVHNPVLMGRLQVLLPRVVISDFRDLGFNPDAKEALLMALLANETLAGNGFPAGVLENVTFGKISLPVTSA